MNIRPVSTSQELADFLAIPATVYRDMPNYRATEQDITKLIIKGPTAFHKHATVKPYLIEEAGKPVGRFALIHDRNAAAYLQIAFFEAIPGLPDLADSILSIARTFEPRCPQVVIGLNGHLNYSAGMLLDHFDEPPVFGLPYTPAYYQDYFRSFKRRTMASFRFPTQPFIELYRNRDKLPDLGGITVRTLNKHKLRQEMEIYTYLNNACFAEHPFWSARTPEEDYELFHPFRWLLRDDFLLFAEYEGKPIGFFLWYPNFNELARGHQTLSLKHVLQYRLRNPIQLFRFTQIAVLPQYRVSAATLALILTVTPHIQKAGYIYGEGGFIFEENIKCNNMTHRFLERATGTSFEPYRRYALFEGSLQ